MGVVRAALGRIACIEGPEATEQTACWSIVRAWPRLTADVRRQALDGAADRLRPVALVALGAGEASLRGAAAELVGDAGWLWAGPALAALVEDEDPGVAACAEESVRRLAVRAGGAEGRPFRESLARMVERWPEHRRRGVLEAAVVALSPGVTAWGGNGEALASWFIQGTSESHMGLRGVVKRGKGAMVRQRAWEWLGRSAAAAAALERVKSADTVAEHEAVLSRAHLLLNPVRAKRVGMMSVRDAGALFPDARTLAALSLESRRGIGTVVRTTAAPDEMKERILHPLLADADAPVRLGAVRSATSGALADFCFDVDASVARHAALRLSAARAGEARTWALLERSPHAAVRRIAREEAAVDPWDAGCERSRALARWWLATDGPRFIDELRWRTREGTVPERTGAIMIARWLGLAHEVELELLETLAAETDERLAAAAVGTLGDVESGSALQAVGACLGHEAGRVRASAVEAALRSPERWAWARERIVEFKADAHHRARATAIRALIVGPGPDDAGAAAELGAMLRDERPLHRLAGLWAVERLALAPEPGSGSAFAVRWAEFATLVAEAARVEPEIPVRERAERCGARMQARVRVMWTPRSVMVGGSAA